MSVYVSGEQARKDQRVLLEKKLKDAGLTISGEEIRKANEIGIITKSQALMSAYDLIRGTSKKDVIRYGYDFLDDKLIGIFKGDLIIVGSETGGGKTTFVNHIANHAAAQGKKVSFYLLEGKIDEMQANDVYFQINRDRIEVGLKGYPYEAYRLNELDDIDEWFSLAYDKLKNGNIHYQKRIDGQVITEDLLLKNIRDTKDEYDLVVIDHLHYIKFNKERSLQEEIESFMRSLSSVIVKDGVRVILVVHYKKLNGNKPTDESFKDAQAIPQNATTTIHIWRDRKIDQEETGSDETENYNEIKKYQTEFFIQKSRTPFGTGSIKAQFNPLTNDYYNHSEWNPGAVPLDKEEEKEQKGKFNKTKPLF